jgi:hypothetical protein
MTTGILALPRRGDEAPLLLVDRVLPGVCISPRSPDVTEVLDLDRVK